MKITKRGVEVDLDPNWEGFTTCEGKIEDINSNRKSAYTHIMKFGDYGSIAYNDLRVLIRIGAGESRKVEAPQRNREFRGKALELWLGDRRDLKWLGIGLLAAGWTMGGFVLGLLRHPDDRPTKFIDLRNEYTLPFIHPDHLKNGPESLQILYNRQAPLRSAVAFTHDFTDTILGLEPLKGDRPQPGTRIFEETASRYEDLYKTQNEERQVLLEKRRSLEGKVLADDRNAMVAMPVIIGESFAGSMLRLEDKLKLWYEGTAVSLKMRQEVSKAFKQDPLYDFNDYRDPSKGPKKKPQTEPDSSDEVNMYQEASLLADAASSQREHIIKFREAPTPLSRANSTPLGLLPDNDFAGLSPLKDFSQLNRKVGQIQASLFDPDKPKIVREPMIGSLDPRLVQQTIERYRFELQLCYELALRRNQAAAGSMEWQWHLDTQGQVYDIELLQSGISDPKMVECVRSKIGSWKWPRPQKGSIQISFPFHFKPAKG